MASKENDETIRQQLNEANNKAQGLSSNLYKLHQRKRAAVFAEKRAEAAIERLEKVEGDTKVYKQISRAFVLYPKEKLVTDSKQQLEKSVEEQSKLQGLMNAFTEKSKAAMAQIAELEKQVAAASTTT